MVGVLVVGFLANLLITDVDREPLRRRAPGPTPTPDRPETEPADEEPCDEPAPPAAHDGATTSPVSSRSPGWSSRTPLAYGLWQTILKAAKLFARIGLGA